MKGARRLGSVCGWVQSIVTVIEASSAATPRPIVPTADAQALDLRRWFHAKIAKDREEAQRVHAGVPRRA